MNSGYSCRSLKKMTDSRLLGRLVVGVRVDVAGLGMTLGFQLGCPEWITVHA